MDRHFNLFSLELFPEFQLFDEAFVPLDILIFQVFQKPFPLPHHFHKTCLGMMVFFMGGEVFSEIIDFIGQDCNLHFR
jgi:hypothetical protein